MTHTNCRIAARSGIGFSLSKNRLPQPGAPWPGIEVDEIVDCCGGCGGGVGVLVNGADSGCQAGKAQSMAAGGSSTSNLPRLGRLYVGDCAGREVDVEA